MRHMSRVVIYSIVIIVFGLQFFAYAQNMSEDINEHLQRTNRRLKIQKQSDSLQIQEDFSNSQESPTYIDRNKSSNYGIDMQAEPSHFPSGSGSNSYESQGAEAKVWQKMRGAKKEKKQNTRLPASIELPDKKNSKKSSSDSLSTSSDQQNLNKNSQK